MNKILFVWFISFSSLFAQDNTYTITTSTRGEAPYEFTSHCRLEKGRIEILLSPLRTAELARIVLSFSEPSLRKTIDTAAQNMVFRDRLGIEWVANNSQLRSSQCVFTFPEVSISQGRLRRLEVDIMCRNLVPKESDLPSFRSLVETARPIRCAFP